MSEDTVIYTVAEVAQMLKCSRRSVVRIFEREPGVLVLFRPETLQSAASDYSHSKGCLPAGAGT
jgi:AraC-like DNA-binding protein